MHDGAFKLADPRANAGGHGNCADHLGNACDTHITAAAQALVHEQVPPCLWLHLTLMPAWVPTDGTRDPTCAARSRSVSHRLPAQDHACAHAIIARERVHGSTHAHRKQQRSSAWPLDTPCSCNEAKHARSHAHELLLPDPHLNRHPTVPRRRPESGVLGNAPADRRPIMVVSGVVRHRQITTSMGASIAPASHGQRAAMRLSSRSSIRACIHCTQAGARDDTRTSQGQKGLRRASARPLDMPSSCLRPAFARQLSHDPRPPGTHPNRRPTLPRTRPGFEVMGRAPAQQMWILVFSGLVRLNRITFSTGASFTR